MLVHQRVFESVLISIKEGHDDKYKAVEIWHGGTMCVYISAISLYFQAGKSTLVGGFAQTTQVFSDPGLLSLIHSSCNDPAVATHLLRRIWNSLLVRVPSPSLKRS